MITDTLCPDPSANIQTIFSSDSLTLPEGVVGIFCVISAQLLALEAAQYLSPIHKGVAFGRFTLFVRADWSGLTHAVLAPFLSISHILQAEGQAVAAITTTTTT